MMDSGFLTLISVSLSASLVGVPLLLRNLGLLSAGLAHSLLGAIAIASLTRTDPLPVSLIYTAVLGNLIYFISRRIRVSGDVVTVIFFTFGVALGILLLGITEEGAEELHHAIMGEIEAVPPQTLIVSVVALLMTLSFVIFFRNRLVLFGFSEEISRVYGVNTTLLGFLLVSLTSVLVVLAIRTVGILLASSLFVIPAMSALLVARGMSYALILSPLISLLSAGTGYYSAKALGLSVPGVIVITLVLFFSASYLFSLIQKRPQ